MTRTKRPTQPASARQLDRRVAASRAHDACRARRPATRPALSSSRPRRLAKYRSRSSLLQLGQPAAAVGFHLRTTWSGIVGGRRRAARAERERCESSRSRPPRHTRQVAGKSASVSPGKADDDVGRERRPIERSLHQAAAIDESLAAPAPPHPPQHGVGAALHRNVQVRDKSVADARPSRRSARA